MHHAQCALCKVDYPHDFSAISILFAATDLKRARFHRRRVRSHRFRPLCPEIFVFRVVDLTVLRNWHKTVRVTSSAERVELREPSPGENFFSSTEITEIKDGLGPMQRWESDVSDPSTVSVIVQRVADGERLKQICKSRGWPYSLVAHWVSENEEVAKAYEQALRLAADDLAQSTVEIADGSNPENIAVDKHRTDVRLKLAGKLYRDRYGEQVQHNVSIDPFSDMLRRVSERRLAALKALQAPAQPDAHLAEKDVTPVATEHELI